MLDEQRSLIIPHFRWLVEAKIAGVSCPQNAEALMLLKQLGLRAFLNLREAALPESWLMTYGFQAEHLPIADFSAPTIPQIEQAIAIINHFLDEDLPVAVHCGAGLGRTGTILACYLVWQGISAQEAIKQVRAQQPGSIETPEQEAVISAYERTLSVKNRQP